MDKDTAKQIMARMETCINLLSEVVQVAHTNCGKHEERILRRGVGHVLSEIQDRLTDPISANIRIFFPMAQTMRHWKDQH